MSYFKKIDLKIAVRPSLILAIAVLALTACTVGPNYVRPSVETPASYKETKEWRKSEPADNVIKGAWWNIFSDPQLDALEEQVDISNQNIIMAEAQFRQARALVQAGRAGYFPAVTTSPSLSRSRSSANTGGASGGTTFSNLLMPADVSWEPDIWGKVHRTVEANQANAQASAADLEAIRLSMKAELAQDYFQLRALDADKKILESAATSYQKFLELTKNQYAAGVASSADVLQAETQLKTTQAQAIDVGVQRAQLEHAIAVLIGKPASVFSIAASPLTALPPDIPAGVPSELLERRPDVAAAERQAAAANARIGVAVAAFYPSLTLSGSGGFEAANMARWLSWPSRFWSVGASIAETVFDGGLRAALTDQARASYDASVASYRQTVLTAFQEVEDNLAALRILEEEARTQEEAVRAAERAVQVTLNQYKAGTVSYLNVIVAQTAALTSERTAEDIAGRRMSSAVLLIKALGGGWDADSLPSGVDLSMSGDKAGKAPDSK
jgi:NodT family efflux transporter outer membrane factor (OMF) lipoprotein